MVNFYKNRKYFYLFSIALLLIGLIGFFVRGVKLDITFSGGAKLTYGYTGAEIDTIEVEKLVKEILDRDSTVQNAKSYEKDVEYDKSLVISLGGTKNLTVEQQDALKTALLEKYSDRTITDGSTTNVEASIGRRFFVRGLIAIGLAAVFIIIYVTLRFSVVSGFTAALTALVALLHDVALIFFVFVLFGIPINDGFIAVILTILGYSVNDTLVIFDRIRENKRAFNTKLTIEELINKSIGQSLTRTINTTMMSLIAIVLVFAFGAAQGLTSIVNFALPMMVGILSGCYSSSFIAPFIWCDLQKFKKKK